LPPTLPPPTNETASRRSTAGPPSTSPVSHAEADLNKHDGKSFDILQFTDAADADITAFFGKM
jgi:hypothetical protein